MWPLTMPIYVLVLPPHPLLLVGGARAPGASFLLIGRQVFLLAHGTAPPRLAAVAGGHWGTQNKRARCQRPGGAAPRRERWGRPDANP